MIKYRLFAGAESCIDITYSADEMIAAWIKVSAIHPFMKRVREVGLLPQLVMENPDQGVLLVGIFDDSMCEPDNGVRHAPRGYSIFWNREEPDEL